MVRGHRADGLEPAGHRRGAEGVDDRRPGAGRAAQAPQPDRRSAGGRPHRHRAFRRVPRVGVAPPDVKDYFRNMSFASASDWRDVYVASAARGLSMAGDFLAATALALALQSAGYGGMAVAGLSLAATLPIVALSPLTGRLVDRVDSRALLLVAGLVQAGVCLALAFVSHPVAIIGLVGLLACGLAVTQPAFAALLPAMVREDDLPKASAIGQTANMTGLLIGPALAGVLVGQFGVRLPLLLDAATYLAIVVASMFLRTRRGGALSRPAD